MRLSRQAIRRRFWYVFNQLYISAYQTVMIVQQYLGPEYCDAAMTIARQASCRYHGLGAIAARRYTI